MLAFEHVERTNLNGFDRPFFRSNQLSSGGNDYSVLRCNPGTIRATVARRRDQLCDPRRQA